MIQSTSGSCYVSYYTSFFSQRSALNMFFGEFICSPRKDHLHPTLFELLSTPSFKLNVFEFWTDASIKKHTTDKIVGFSHNWHLNFITEWKSKGQTVEEEGKTTGQLKAQIWCSAGSKGELNGGTNLHDTGLSLKWHRIVSLLLQLRLAFCPFH